MAYCKALTAPTLAPRYIRGGTSSSHRIARKNRAVLSPYFDADDVDDDGETPVSAFDVHVPSTSSRGTISAPPTSLAPPLTEWRYTYLYDGSCAFCQSLKTTLESLPRGRTSIAYVNVAQHSYRPESHGGIEKHTAMGALHAVPRSGGAPLIGVAALEALFDAAGGGPLSSLVFRQPIMARAVKAMYAAVSRARRSGQAHDGYLAAAAAAAAARDAITAEPATSLLLSPRMKTALASAQLTAALGPKNALQSAVRSPSVTRAEAISISTAHDVGENNTASQHVQSSFSIVAVVPEHRTSFLSYPSALDMGARGKNPNWGDVMRHMATR